MMLMVSEGERPEMGDEPALPADWTEPEKWVWERIAAGELADLNARDREQDPDFKDLDPVKATGWADNRRLRAKFLQTVLTRKAFARATPDGGLRIVGALVDDAPLDLEHARLQRLFWLEKSRILVDVKGRNICVDGEFSLEGCYVSGRITLVAAKICAGLSLAAGHYKSNVNLNGAKVTGNAFLRDGATFRGEVNLTGATIGSNLEMTDSTFEDPVFLTGANIGSTLHMIGSTFESPVILSAAKVTGIAYLCDATFKGEVNLVSATIGSDLDFSAAKFSQRVDLTGSRVDGELRLGSSRIRRHDGRRARRWCSATRTVPSCRIGGKATTTIPGLRP